jgi:ribosomal protein L24
LTPNLCGPVHDRPALCRPPRPLATLYRQGMVAKLLMLDMKKGKAIVEGVNMRSKHVKPMKEGESGRILKKEFPIAISNIKLESAAEKAPAAAPAA